MADYGKRQIGSIVVLLVCALVVGMAIGLFSAWEVWPQRRLSAVPADLELEGQVDYLVLVAHAFADSGDTGIARNRLDGLIDEDTSWEQLADLASLAEAYEASQGRLESSAHVHQLAEAVGWSEVATAGYIYVEQGASLRLLAVLASVLFLGLVGVVWMLIRLFRCTSESLASTASMNPASVAEVSQTVAPVSDISHDENGRAVVDSSPDDSGPAPLPLVEMSPSEAQLEIQPDMANLAHSQTPMSDTAVEDSAAGSDSSMSASALDEILELMDDFAEPAPACDSASFERHYAASYVFGDDEYTVSFNVEDAEGAFLGECGVSTAEVMSGLAPQHVVAFEIWMFDKSDVQTASQILCSKWALEDANLRALLEPRGELLQAREELEVTFDRLSTIVTFTVKEMAMGQERDQPENAWFDRLGFDVCVRVKEVPSL